MEVLTIIAILISPVIAVYVSMWIQERRSAREQQMHVFATLIALRHSPVIDENVRALNLIDIVFYKKTKVRQLWREYYDMLGNEGLNNPQGFVTRQKKYIEMVHEMAKALNYGEAFNHLDADRVYYPQALGEQSQRSEEIANELLRVLKASSGVQVVPRISASSRSRTSQLTNQDDR